MGGVRPEGADSVGVGCAQVVKEVRERDGLKVRESNRRVIGTIIQGEHSAPSSSGQGRDQFTVPHARRA